MSAATFNPTSPEASFAAGSIPNNRNYYNYELSNFKKSAANLANQILTETDHKRYDGPVVIRHHYYHYSPGFWSPVYYRPRPVVFIDPRAAGQIRRDRENESKAVIGLLATIASFVFLYSIGTAIGRYQDASLEANSAAAFYKSSNFQRSVETSPREQAKCEEASTAALLKGRICNRFKNSALLDLTLRIAGFVGASTLALGAFLSVPPFAVAGTCILIGSVASMIFKWGLNDEERRNRIDAMTLQDSLEHLNQL